ncbi:hypothetical protein SAMN05518669_103427 [Variovorax sp. YR634]|uniref:HNH endonuclease signature motif containing protein n=1 Tax=Variovorax sp. YR634 TaxID=1884385 RepID=UPI00089BC505|nr:HNH endonuclease signature motif containing protein [Variovorax sp. YR634]SDX15820.1 hypothetical protein SAMN05518669_103427 [Variovorax sp. YR634]
MKLTKAQRATLREMFDGQCAYCGCDLSVRWHADHVEPVTRELLSKQTERGTWKLISGKPLHPERDCIENLMPACAPCNIDKHAMTLEEWRTKLSRTLIVLDRDYPTYRHAVRFGLVQETGAEVTFHFERRAALKGATPGGEGASNG